MDRIDALRAFVEVGTAGSFSLAARRLGLSKALVSRQVAQLEQELGVELFGRKGKRLLGLTDPGHEIAEIAERILVDIGNIKRLGAQLAACRAPIEAVDGGRIGRGGRGHRRGE